MVQGGLNIVESRGTGILSGEMATTALKKSLSPGKRSPSANLQKEKIQPGFNNALQLKASRDVCWQSHPKLICLPLMSLPKHFAPFPIPYPSSMKVQRVCQHHILIQIDYVSIWKWSSNMKMYSNCQHAIPVAALWVVPTYCNLWIAAVQVAMAMASRAKMLLRELKTVKGDLTFVGNRCSQLEEENKRLRESMVKGVRPDEDDLVSLARLWLPFLFHNSRLLVTTGFPFLSVVSLLSVWHMVHLLKWETPLWLWFAG